MPELHTDILIVGGGTGGVAAALAAGSLGHRVILTEPNRWLGGQFTSQMVPPDENPWIETCGATASLQRYRHGVRRYYREHYPLTAAARAQRLLNPGGGGATRPCHEPRVGAAVIDQLLAPLRATGRLRILQPYRPIDAETRGDRITAVTLEHTLGCEPIVVTADYVLDATELGDVIALSGTEYVSGAESRADTNELHAIDGPAEPDNVQALTWCMALAHDSTPGADHTIDRPERYDFWRDHTPDLSPPWAGRLLSFHDTHPHNLSTRHNALFPGEPTAHAGRAYWTFRQLLDPVLFDTNPPMHAVTCVNWPMNDYMLGNIIDQPEEVVAKHLQDARQLSLSLVYWLQTEAPNLTTGSTGYPGLYLRPDVAGTDDGLAQAPYIRESRRIKAEFTVTEAHCGCEMRWGNDSPYDPDAGRAFDPQRGPICDNFDDAVGVAHYGIDLHPSTNGRNYVDVGSVPCQIPLGALLPQRVDNLLPACKNIGTTHISSGMFRVHPVEWNIGESAGLLAAYALATASPPRQIRTDPIRLREFQTLLQDHGVSLHWPWQNPPGRR